MIEGEAEATIPEISSIKMVAQPAVNETVLFNYKLKLHT